MRSLTLQIDGMSCAHCLHAVTRALGGLVGVSVKSVRIGRAEVEFDEAVRQPADLVEAVEGEGYRVVSREPA